MKFCYGSGSVDPYIWLMDRDPAFFAIDSQDVKNNKNFKFFAYFFLKVHLHHFSKIKSHNEVTKQ
jgi:hypothetical protein